MLQGVPMYFLNINGSSKSKTTYLYEVLHEVMHIARYLTARASFNKESLQQEESCRLMRGQP